ncbi:MAG: WXG100 family type VII secretion target [Actinomycetota bacterium]|nr:WXG100 family type VII secretion target [Actinomycetota bacterium]
MSWQPLCESNPIPGNPDGVAVLSKNLASVACELREQTLTLQRISSEDFWEGDAADEFREHQTKLPPYLEQLATRYEKVSDALGEYHPELHEAQQEAFRALQKAQQAEQDIRAAELRVQQKAQWERDEQCRVDTWNAANPKEPPLSAQGWDYSQGGDPAGELAAAHAALAAARRELECAIERYEDAARRCAQQIESAIDDELKNESGLLALGKKIFALFKGLMTLKNLATYYEIVSLVFAGLALAFAWFPPLAAAFGIAAAAAGVIKLLITLEMKRRGDADWGDVAEEVGWTALGVATLGVGRLAKAGKLGKLLLKNHETVKKIADAVDGGVILWKIGSWILRRLDPEPETRPRCDFVPRPCIYRPPVCCPAKSTLEVEHGAPPPSLEVGPGSVPPRIVVQGSPSPRDVAVLHRVQPGGVVAASPQPTADVVLQGS